MDEQAIPVLYYHSVADHTHQQPWSFLSCDIATFRMQMRYLKLRGYKTCNWDELYAHMQGTKRLGKKSVMVQFDDGFLDNWTVVFPIMKQLGFRFSVLVTPEFIDNQPLRPFTEKTAGVDPKTWWGYLGEAELLAMHRSTLVDIQAHGYTHTWLPCTERIIDLFDGTQQQPWLLWNHDKTLKPRWLTRHETFVHGYPVFEYEKSLSNLRAFLPDERFIEAALDYYDVHLSKAENLEAVNRLAQSYKNMGKLGRFETTEETEARFKQELLGARKMLEQLLGKRVEYMVWPGGGNSEHVKALAFRYGYKLISKADQPNRFGSKAHSIMRVAGFQRFQPRWLSPYLNVVLIQVQIWRGEGNFLFGHLVRLLKRIRSIVRRK